MTTMDSVERLKEEGNAHFDARRWDVAVAAYLDGLSALPAVPVEGEGEAATDTEGGTDGEEERTRVLRVQLYSNLAAAYLKLGDAAGAMEAATNALRHDPGYSKARYRRAVAAESLGGWSNLSQALDGKPSPSPPPPPDPTALLTRLRQTTHSSTRQRPRRPRNASAPASSSRRRRKKPKCSTNYAGSATRS